LPSGASAAALTTADSLTAPLAISKAVPSSDPSGLRRASVMPTVVPPAITILPSGWTSVASADDRAERPPIFLPSPSGPPGSNVASSEPSALRRATAGSNEPVRPATTSFPSGCSAADAILALAPMSTPTDPSPAQLRSSEPSGLSRSTVKLWSSVTTILPSG
jgi:hypothetical protein